MVNAFKDMHTASHIGINSIGHFGPLVLVVVQNSWCVLGQSQFKTGIGVNMAVGQVVDQLTDFPTARAIGLFEIFGLEGLDLFL